MFCQISFSGFGDAGMNLKKKNKKGRMISIVVSQRKANISHQKDRVILRKQRRLLSIKDIVMYQIGKD